MYLRSVFPYYLSKLKAVSQRVLVSILLVSVLQEIHIRKGSDVIYEEMYVTQFYTPLGLRNKSCNVASSIDPITNVCIISLKILNFYYIAMYNKGKIKFRRSLTH